MCTSTEYELNTLFIVCVLEISEDLHLCITTYTIYNNFMKPHNITAINHSNR